jgi:hypothetical protein
LVGLRTYQHPCRNIERNNCPVVGEGTKIAKKEERRGMEEINKKLS